MTILTKITSTTLAPKVWGQPSLVQTGFDDTSTTFSTAIDSDQAYYIEHDQATPAADTSLDLAALFNNAGIGVIQRCFLTVRSPDGDPIDIELFKDGVSQGVFATFSSVEWRWVDLGDIVFPQLDYLSGVEYTLRLSGGLSHSAFLLLLPRAIYYEAEDEPGADVTATDSLSYAFNGEETRRDAPWDLSPDPTILFGPITPTIAPNTIDDEFVQPVGFWEEAPGETDNPELILIVNGVPPYTGSDASGSVVIAGTVSPTTQNQTVAVASGDPMSSSNSITGTGIKTWGRGFYLTQGDVLEIGITAGWPIDNDVAVRLDAVVLARPADAPFFTTGDCEGNTYPVGTTFAFGFGHSYPGLVVGYEQLVIDTADWTVAQGPTAVTSPSSVDTSDLMPGGVYWTMIRAYYDDGSFEWTVCEFTVGDAEYGPCSLAQIVSM